MSDVGRDMNHFVLFLLIVLINDKAIIGGELLLFEKYFSLLRFRASN